MAETSLTLSSATNESYGKRDSAEEEMIKVESEVVVKMEPAECAACGALGERDLLESEDGLGASLARLSGGVLLGRLLCRACAELVRLLARAEAEYLRLRDAFDAVLAGNPLYRSAPPAPESAPAAVKREATPPALDSEDEPLARSRRKHSTKGVKKKKKAGSIKQKGKNSTSFKLYDWECEDCGARGGGGAVARAAHCLALHALPAADGPRADAHIKTEDLPHADMSQSPFNNGLENGVDISFGDFDEDDDDSTFNPDDFLTPVEPKKKSRVGQKQRKTWYPCGQCNARFSSLIRLEQHRLKHDGSKPPYICEVCGAHYKHKRACDIHIALHKGISDWKCEECNKLFPSKNALQRHNNIHTGKLNYQCDLCGKSFIHTSSFKMHKLSHSGVKPHACDVCGLALMTRSHLKRHKRIHSGEKRHECAVCGKRFSERYNLAAHAKSHESPAPPTAEPAPRRRLFRCHFCTERFERRYMLERHMSVLHGRTLERPPPTPRNTMSKLLKAQAQARQGDTAETEAKEEREAGPGGRVLAPAKLLAQLSSSGLSAAAWPAAYAADFPLRPDFPH